MKHFLKKITHDAYFDWFVLLTGAGLALVCLVALSVVEYQKVDSVEVTGSTAVTGNARGIDTKKLDALLDTFKERKINFEKGVIDKVDADDPSL